MKKFSVLFVALALAIGFVSCKSNDDDPDTLAPTIEIVKPAANTSIVAGAELAIEVNFTDDVELKSWKYSVAKKAAKKNVDTFTAEGSGTLTGKEAKGTASKEVLGTAIPGTYTLKVTATDATGNTSSEKTIDFEVTID